MDSECCSRASLKCMKFIYISLENLFLETIKTCVSFYKHTFYSLLKDAFSDQI